MKKKEKAACAVAVRRCVGEIKRSTRIGQLQVLRQRSRIKAEKKRPPTQHQVEAPWKIVFRTVQ